MANYLELGQSLMKHLPQTEGSASTVKLSKKGIEVLTKKDPELGKAIEEFTSGATNPTIELAQKAQSNYAIVGFKIRNEENTLVKGAYSKSLGKNGTVEKMHIETDSLVKSISKEGNAEPISNEIPKTKVTAPKIKTHEESLDDFIQEINDPNNYFGMKINTGNYKDMAILKSMTPNEFHEFSNVIRDAKDLEIFFPNAVDFRGDEFLMAVETSGGKKQWMQMDVRRPNDINSQEIPVFCNNTEMMYIPVDKDVNLKNIYTDFTSSNRMNRFRSHLKLGKLIRKHWNSYHTEQVQNATEAWKRYENASRAERDIEMHALKEAMKRRGASKEDMRQVFNPSCQAECDFSGATLKYYKNQHLI